MRLNCLLSEIFSGSRKLLLCGAVPFPVQYGLSRCINDPSMLVFKLKYA